MNSLRFSNTTVANIVREDYRTAEVFKKYGISYCCGGNISLKDTCEKNHLNYGQMIVELEAATKDISVPNSLNFSAWKTDFLVDYITNVHHGYLNQVLPALEAHLLSFVESHKNKFPEFSELLEVFRELSSALQVHNRYEEETIFPYIKQIEYTYRRKETYGNLFVKTLRKPLENFEQDHKRISVILKEIRAFTNDYTYPADACTNHRVIVQRLKELDNDMVQHIHLENNILFPRAIQLEKELLQF